VADRGRPWPLAVALKSREFATKKLGTGIAQRGV